eukprot:228400-Rhodomonas_salina.1
MLRNGIDFLSREGTVDKHDARATDAVWELAQAMASAGDMTLTADWFSDVNNKRCARFWAREPAPGAEGVDSLRASTWGRDHCLACKRDHDQGAWIFAPIPLMSKVVTKLKVDKAHGVALVAYRPDTVWWTTLELACHGDNAIVEVSSTLAVDTSAITEHAA